jgi:hypothetical protein
MRLMTASSGILQEESTVGNHEIQARHCQFGVVVIADAVRPSVVVGVRLSFRAAFLEGKRQPVAAQITAVGGVVIGIF